MKQQIENIIKENLPEKNEIYPINVEKQDEKWNYLNGFNRALSQINTSLIADEVLKVVVEKILNLQVYVASIPEIDHSLDSYVQFNQHPAGNIIFKDDIIKELSNLSPNKENEK